MTSDIEILKAVVPLLAVIFTAAFSGYVIPLIARRWKDQEKELELKISLIESINDRMVRFIVVIQYAEAKLSTQEDFDAAYRTWETDSAIVASKVRSYFGVSDLSLELNALFGAVTDLWALAGTYEPELRKNRTAKLKAFFGANTTDWDLLEDQSKRSNEWMVWFKTWLDVRQAFFSRKDAIVDKLLTAKIEFRPKQ